MMKQNETIIHIIIKEMKEEGTKYFLGTSPELEGLLIEGNSIEEIKKEAPGVIKAYIESVNELKNNESITLKKILENNLLKINFNYNREKILKLA